ncbi:5-oxoprolinase [gamma proteobacterium HTCC5015]|nr:5-oxoprolinase [gamma proteobacterium HTCC5015]
MSEFDPIALIVFANRMDAICDEMGAQLRRAALSPNIRDRLDYSCAIFDADGELCAQAAHIPVHLGSMAYAMRDIVAAIDWRAGDQVILNDPYKGGTHLPDVTLVAPVFVEQALVGFVANRAHHADIGAEAPGSMPLSKSLLEEGVVIHPQHWQRAGEACTEVRQRLLSALRNPQQSEGDFDAQCSANRRGVQRVAELVEFVGSASVFSRQITALNHYADRLAHSALMTIPAGEYRASDVLDDDGQGRQDIAIELTLRVSEASIEVDFEGTAEQVAGNLNCPLSVAAAAVFYVFRCLMPEETPACAGAFRRIELKAPEGSVVNARYPAAVAAGNVETSSRIVDVVMRALTQALPERMPALSHGGMNNLAMGYRGDAQYPAWDYYETMGGGMGAGPDYRGLDAVQTHMTNTLNTPIEVLEKHYPLRVLQYAQRYGSGGEGAHRGGDGIVRELAFLAPAEVTLLTERRRTAPAGAAGGGAGKCGVNRLNDREVAGKASLSVAPGDRLTIESPGGGAYGRGD